MPTNREISRLDSLFASHLGTNLYGDPIYSWKYSENLHHPMRVAGQYEEHKSEETVKCPECKGTGTLPLPSKSLEIIDAILAGDTSIPDNNEAIQCWKCEGVGRTHLTIMKPKYILRRMCYPFLFEQWVICKWCEPFARDRWVQVFGEAMEWPARGYLIATNACLLPHEPPDVSATWEFINKMKEDRTRTFYDWAKQAEDALDLQERRDDSRIAAELDDVCTAFGNPKPGTVGGGISLASAAFKRNYDKAFAPLVSLFKK